MKRFPASPLGKLALAIPLGHVPRAAGAAP
jgi:hypothetical protein